MRKEIFSSQEDFKNLSHILEKWTCDELNMKSAFLRLIERFMKKEKVVLAFVSRPGVSYSLRASIRRKSETDRLVTLIDIVDDDPDDKWLSVCFYDECVTDPAGKGNMVPEGVLGIDGYCFDLYENSENIIAYVEKRIDEAYENTMKLSTHG